MNDEEREYLNETIRSLNNQLVDALRERDEMQSELRKAETECSMLRVECGVIVAERDEARRMYCGRVSRDVPLDAFEIAKNHGWDCFKEDEK